MLYDPDVEFGKAVVIQTGRKATVIAVSVMLDAVMEACKDKDVTVLYYTTLEPFDKTVLRENCESGKILIVEPEYRGTLLEDIHDALPDKRLIINHVAFPKEIFRNYGTYEEKMDYYGLNSQNISDRLEEMIDW